MATCIPIGQLRTRTPFTPSRVIQAHTLVSQQPLQIRGHPGMDQPSLRRRQSSNEAEPAFKTEDLQGTENMGVSLESYAPNGGEPRRSRSGTARIPMFDLLDLDPDARPVKHFSPEKSLSTVSESLLFLTKVILFSLLIVAAGVGLQHLVGTSPPQAHELTVEDDAFSETLVNLESIGTPRRLAASDGNERLRVFPRGQYHVAPLYLRFMDLLAPEVIAPTTIKVTLDGDSPNNGNVDHELPAGGIVTLGPGTHHVRAALYPTGASEPTETIDTEYYVTNTGGQFSFSTYCHTQTIGCVVFNETYRDVLANYGRVNQPDTAPLPITGFTNASQFAQADNVLAIVQEQQLFVYGDCNHVAFPLNCAPWETAGAPPLTQQGYQYYKTLAFDEESRVVNKSQPSFMLRIPNMRTDFTVPNGSVYFDPKAFYYRWSYDLEDGGAAGPVALPPDHGSLRVLSVKLSSTHGLLLVEDGGGAVHLYGFGSCDQGGLFGMATCASNPKAKAFVEEMPFPDSLSPDAHLVAVDGASLLAQGSTLYAWGPRCLITTHVNTTTGQCFPAPTNPLEIDGPWTTSLTGITSVAASNHHVLVAAGGKVYSWGSCSSKLLGYECAEGSPSVLYSPKEVVLPVGTAPLHTPPGYSHALLRYALEKDWNAPRLSPLGTPGMDSTPPSFATNFTDAPVLETVMHSLPAFAIKVFATKHNTFVLSIDGRLYASGACWNGALGRPCELEYTRRAEYWVDGVLKNLTLPFSTGSNASIALVPGLPEVSTVSGDQAAFAIDTGAHRTVWQWGSCVSAACRIVASNNSVPRYNGNGTEHQDQRAFVPTPRFDLWDTTAIAPGDVGVFHIGGRVGYIEFENSTQVVTTEKTSPSNPLDFVFPGEWFSYRVFRQGGSSGPVVAEIEYEVSENMEFGIDYMPGPRYVSWEDGDTEPKDVHFLVIDNDVQQNNTKSVNITVSRLYRAATVTSGGQHEIDIVSENDTDTRVPPEPWGSIQFDPNGTRPLLESEAAIQLFFNGSTGGPQATVHYYIHEHYQDGTRALKMRRLRLDDPVYTGAPIQLPIGHVTLNVDIHDPDRHPGFLPRSVTASPYAQWRGITSMSFIVLPSTGAKVNPTRIDQVLGMHNTTQNVTLEVLLPPNTAWSISTIPASTLAMTFTPSSGTSGSTEESRSVRIIATLGSTTNSGVTLPEVIQGTKRFANITLTAGGVDTAIPVNVDYKTAQLLLISDRVEGIAQPNTQSTTAFVFDNVGSAAMMYLMYADHLPDWLRFIDPVTEARVTSITNLKGLASRSRGRINLWVNGTALSPGRHSTEVTFFAGGLDGGFFTIQVDIQLTSLLALPEEVSMSVAPGPVGEEESIAIVNIHNVPLRLLYIIRNGDALVGDECAVKVEKVETSAPSPSPTPNPQATPTFEPDASPTANATADASPSFPPEASPSPSASSSASPSASSSASSSASPSSSPSGSSSSSPSAPSSSSPSASSSSSPSASISASPSLSPSSSPSPSQNATSGSRLLSDNHMEVFDVSSMLEGAAPRQLAALDTCSGQGFLSIGILDDVIPAGSMVRVVVGLKYSSPEIEFKTQSRTLRVVAFPLSFPLCESTGPNTPTSPSDPECVIREFTADDYTDLREVIINFTPTEGPLDTIETEMFKHTTGTEAPSPNINEFKSTLFGGEPLPANWSEITPHSGQNATVTVGSTVTLFIRGRDRFGNPKSVGGERIIATAPDGVFARVDDLDDGNYVVEIDVRELGEHTIDVTSNGLSLAVSPLTVVGVSPHCNPKSEVLDPSGVECLCRPGYNGVAGGCFPCASGSFSPEAGLKNCIQCGDGSYSFPGSVECTACPSDGVNCQGGRLCYETGWWRERFNTPVTASTVMFECEDSSHCQFVSMDPSIPNPPPPLSPCLGSLENETSLLERATVLCRDGHTGPFCAVCEDGYAKVGQGCEECWSTAANWIGATVLFSVLISLVSFIIQRSGQRRSMTMSIIRVMLSWLQATSMLGSFHLRGPEVVTEMLGLSSIGDGISLDLFPIQCSFRWGFYTHYYVNLALPVLCYVIPSVVIWSQFCIKRYSADRGSIANLQNGVGLEGSGSSVGGLMRPIDDSRGDANASRSPTSRGGLRGGGKPKASGTAAPPGSVNGDKEAKPAAKGRRRHRPSDVRRFSRITRQNPDALGTVRANPLHRTNSSPSPPASDSEPEASAAGGNDVRPATEEDFAENMRANESPLLRLRRLARNKVATATVVLLFLIHTRVSKVIFQIFDVHDKEVYGQAILKEDPAIIAEGGAYTTAVVAGVLGALLFAMGIPFLAVWILYRRRHKLDDPDVRVKFGFLYDGYDLRKGRYLWEAVVLTRKIGITLIGRALNDSFIQAYTASLLITLALMVHLIAKPYVSRLMNNIETASLVVLFLTMMGTILTWRLESLKMGSETALTIFLIVINLGMFLVFVYFILVSASPALARVFRACANRYECCRRCGLRSAVDEASKPTEDTSGTVRRELEETTTDSSVPASWNVGGFGDGIPGSVLEMVSTARARSQGSDAHGGSNAPAEGTTGGSNMRQMPSQRFGRLGQYVNPRSAQLSAMFAAAETDGDGLKAAASPVVFTNPLAGAGRGPSSAPALTPINLPPPSLPSAPSPRRKSRRYSYSPRHRSGSASGSPSRSPTPDQEALSGYRSTSVNDFLNGRGRPRRGTLSSVSSTEKQQGIVPRGSNSDQTDSLRIPPGRFFNR